MRFSLMKCVLAMTWCGLSPFLAAAARPHSKSRIQMQERKLVSLDNVLSPEDFIACTTKLGAGIESFYPDTAIDTEALRANGPGFNESYQTFKHVFTRNYCEDTVDFIYDLSVSSNYTQRAMLNGAHQKMKEADIRRQRALTVSLRGDQENDAFYPPSGGGYDGYTIGASTADCPDRFREGCLEDAQGALWTAYTAARLAHYLADAITAGDIGGIFVTAAKIAAATALVVIENIIDIYAFIDGYTGGAEQSIANANVKVLLENQAKIFNKFSIDGTLTTRRQRLMAGAGENTEEGDTRHMQTTTYLRGYGCDGVDNDNSGQVDDCDEDVIPATLRLSDGGFCSSQHFLSEAELLACVDRYLVAEDDCDTVTGVTSSLTAACASTLVDYRAETQRCTANNVEKTFGPFKLDLDSPTLQPLRCPTDALPHTLEMVDLGPLGIIAADDCGIATVTVKVTSDEETRSIDAQIYKTAGEDYGVMLRAQSLTVDTCNPLETDCDQVCFDGRKYAITVEATDVAGRSISETCVVDIALPDNYTAASNCRRRSNQTQDEEQIANLSYLLALSDTPKMTQVFCTQAEYFRLLGLGATDLIPPAGYGCNGINDNCDDLQQVDECAEDVYGPTINSEVAIAAVREKWYTNAEELLSLLTGTVEISDDCGIASYTDISLISACRESTVTMKIEDRCGNPAMEVIPVLFDPTPPTIHASVANRVLYKYESKKFYIDVGLSDLSKVISDACDPTPMVEIEVFSDELPLLPGKSLPIVQLVRKYTTQDVLFTGWRVNVNPNAAKVCDGHKHKHLCEEADGRVYTIRVCATNVAELRTCQELEVEVPLLVKGPWKKGGRELASKVHSATSQGKLFLIQSDSAKLNAI